MSKAELGHLFAVVHIVGMVMILSLPVSALALQREMAQRDFPVVAQLGTFLGRMDRVAQIGAGVMLATGAGQMWAKGITLPALKGEYLWLGGKLMLFALLLINGAALAGPAVRNRVHILQGLAGGGQPTEAQEVALARSAQFMAITGIPQMVLILGILILVSFSWKPGY